jgi:glycosyltransferase involved in cell wall biosynthesis
MAKQIRVGIIYSYNENWIGGTYYIQNLISALNYLPENRKPEIVIFTKTQKEFEELKNSTAYKFLYRTDYLRKLSFLQKAINKISRIISKKNIFSVFQIGIDVVFPAVYENKFNTNQNFLYWIPDFQEHYLPSFFSADELSSRKNSQMDIVKKAQYIVFSSICAKNDFNKFYPQNNLLQYVLPFAVMHPILDENNSVNIQAKYKIPHKYFICCNQFWKHKNHQVILQAVFELKKKNIIINIVFTGKEYDYRNPAYTDDLKKKIDSFKIKDQIFFLGFISRVDQLMLMKNSIAIIQPSLFEGWSTVVEDAKAINKTIIASNIPVHYEQLNSYDLKYFFDPYSASELANNIMNAETNVAAMLDYDYKPLVKQFGESFYDIIHEISSHK